MGVAVGALLSMAGPAEATTYEVKIGGLQKIVLPGTPPACHAYGVLRFPAIKGVDSYTLVFNDAYYGGAERSVTVSAPFPEDNFETPYGTIKAGGGVHQKVYTALHSGSGDCSVDMASRLSNVRMIYSRGGSHIAGWVTKACDTGRCGIKGVKVVAKRRGGSGGASATTSSLGYYTMKVKPGDYNVAPRDRKVTFSPDHRKVKVKKESTANASFSAREKGKNASLTVAVRPDHPELNVEEQPGGELKPASTAVRVVVTNTGNDTATDVNLGRLRIEWDEKGVKAPEPLPLAQTLGPIPGSLGDLDPGESGTVVYAVEARGDGWFELTARASGTDPDGAVSGRGSAKVKSSSPVLFMYARVDRRVESKDAPGLFTAGTAFTVRLRLQNRSYSKYVAVEPIAPGLAGNAHDGSVQEAGKPIQVGPSIESMRAVNQARYEVLKPRQNLLLDVVVRTHAEDPADLQDGTRAIVSFTKPGALLWDRKKGTVTKLDPARVALAPDAPLHIVGVDQSTPSPSPFDPLRAVSNFSTGALVGIAQSLVGVVRGIFYDLPLLAWHGSSAMAQSMIERTAELWRAAKRERGARAKFDAVMTEGKRQLLADFRKLGEVPGKLRRAANEAYDGVGKKMTAIANQWYAGDWEGAALDMGLATGRTAGDIVLADLALARAIAVAGRVPAVVRAAEKVKTSAQKAGRRAAEAFTRRAQSAERVARFVATKLKTGYVFNKLEELTPLFGLTRNQARFLAKLAKERQVLITVRSRGAGALKWLRKKAAYVKPEWIKIKTVNRIDTEYLGFHPSHLDSVVVNKNLPTEAEVVARLDAAGVTDPVERAAVLQRRKDRQFELDTDEPGYVKQLEGYASSNAEVKSDFNWKDNQLDPKGRGSKKSTAQFRMTEEGNPGNVVVRVKVGKRGGYKRVTGDNDVVSITKADGTPLSNDELVEILDELRGPPMCIQHPATDTWVRGGAADFAAKRKELSKERPVQFAPDGKARLVEFVDAASWFKSALEYNVAWAGGYRHIGNYPAPSYTKPQKPFRSPAPCFVSR
ncbi:MAG: hypothetical protein EDQ89_02835 [Acidobacteria bacterium]|nr:MAG: hypothetical protein EDQ89_02835 [Acidobacteriota bacterium]